MKNIKYKIIKKKYIVNKKRYPELIEIYYIKKKLLFFWKYLRPCNWSNVVLTFNNHESAENYIKELIKLKKELLK